LVRAIIDLHRARTQASLHIDYPSTHDRGIYPWPYLRELQADGDAPAAPA